jgi:hypothetical protein
MEGGEVNLIAKIRQSWAVTLAKRKHRQQNPRCACFGHRRIWSHYEPDVLEMIAAYKLRMAI